MSDSTKLTISRTFAASVDRVYAAWTQASQFEQWMCRDESSHLTQCKELNVRPGGQFLSDIHTPDGDTYLQHGKFVEVVPGKRLVFTWSYDKLQAKGMPYDFHSPDTLVAVEFRALGDSTELTLTHERFTTREEQEGTYKGWNGCFDVLEKVLAGSAAVR